MKTKSNNNYSQLLTKSLYLNGLQCQKLLWIMHHEKEKIPEPDEALKHIFEQGYQVGELAKTLFSDGIDVGDRDFNKAIEKSLNALKLRKPLFEAGFLTGSVYSRADILIPVKKDEWNIIEVKSTTKVEEEHYRDVSFQKYCYENAGLKIRKCFLMHVNNEYARKGKINVKEFFVKEDITKQISEVTSGIKERISEMQRILFEKCPATKIGPYCNNPHECPLKDYCWKHIPIHSVFELYRGGKKSFELFDLGVVNLEDIPEDYKLNEKQMIQHKCAKTKRLHIHREKIKEFLNKLKYPLYFLDFETYSTAIPLYNNLKPYQAIPFQFSLYIVKNQKSKPKHYSFIAEDSDDPRKKFIEKLKSLLGKKGSIVIYNQGFEQTRLEELAERFPKYKRWEESVIKRMIDLLVPFREFYYYNSKQQGSASIKAVLPALTNKSYESMEIADGTTASLQYLYITHGASDGAKASPDEVKRIRKNLEKYCGLDTMGMIWIVEKLGEVVK